MFQFILSRHACSRALQCRALLSSWRLPRFSALAKRSATLAGTATATALVAAASCENDSSSHIFDPLSKLEHPRQLQIASSSSTFGAVGCGTRAVTFLAQLQEEGSLLKAATSPDSERLLRIAPYRRAAFSHLRDGFTRALETRLRRRMEQDTASVEQELAAIALLKQSFPSGYLQPGDELLLHMNQGTLTLIHNGEVRATIASSFVCSELTLNYLDEDTVSPSARESMLAGLYDLLAV